MQGLKSASWAPTGQQPDMPTSGKRKGYKEATPLKYFPEYVDLQAEGDRALLHFAQTPDEMTVLMACYCETLGKMAA
jgi:hypothetical protein